MTNDCFTDHFPDKVVAVLSELAMKRSAASSNAMTRQLVQLRRAPARERKATTRSAGTPGGGGGGGDRARRPDGGGANLMEDAQLKEQRVKRGVGLHGFAATTIETAQVLQL